MSGINLSRASKTFDPPNADDPIEAQIYAGFPSEEDVLNMEEFHELPPNEKLAHIAKFTESKYRSFGLESSHQNYRNNLTTLLSQDFPVGNK